MAYFCTPKTKRGVRQAHKNCDDLVAQLVEHNTFNVRALGSSPSGITLNSLAVNLRGYLFIGIAKNVFVPGCRNSIGCGCAVPLLHDRGRTLVRSVL